MTIAPVAIPRSNPSGSAGRLAGGTSGADGVNAADVDDVAGEGHSHSAATAAELDACRSPSVDRSAHRRELPRPVIGERLC